MLWFCYRALGRFGGAHVLHRVARDQALAAQPNIKAAPAAQNQGNAAPAAPASPAACRVPGQFVAARYCPQASGSSSTDECSDLRVAQRLLCLASSPYEARRDSALLDASLVELLVSRAGQ